MAKTFFFYDLETSGLNAREARIMQFAGIRTDMDLKQVGEPVNVLVRLNDDTLPSPEAIMVTGITPQQTVEGGFSEAEFSKMLVNDIFTVDTIAVGFNNVRFDDEFIRHLFWRNFFDPYEWSWKDGRSRWDLLDVVRMTRALRPEGIKWPVDRKGVATNRLELIASVNGIDHFKAHDALSDVEALIAVTKLIRDKQPQLYEYLLKMRDKNEVKKLVNLDYKQPFVYVSGRLDGEYNKATVSFPLTAGKNGNVIVYDLRYDPTPYIDMSSKDLAKKLYATWEDRQADDFVRLPIKELQYNHTPAVAPIGVLEQGEGWKKISLDEVTVTKHKSILLTAPGFAENIRSLFENREDFKKSPDPELQLYDGFVPDVDKMRIEKVRNSKETELSDFHPNFTDERLDPLLLHYKARNFPKSLAEDEVVAWEKWRSDKIIANLPAFATSLQKLSTTITDENKLFLLQELHLWAESIMPVEFDN
ncbi:exodeoxyribonuclease I [Candidatus Saccharibacteria bacterium CG11_big_fil_rev_8_21_14_0_20_41_19]|nr:exodeoxyribonuclease I [Candidatus Saccharibacteria bacterium]OIP86095.1 MAG: exodeoxyribonuclease I [Candidatus Saccharibacteria bacterium CG2_30_41_52]PIQ70620.1 MAG: exodeoxyribonuclease I [Candidatus Saccharibacteria bacterium CG11_big_fil_rev_8_21_14_0_20_41_19]PJC29915.1 MAG: exodeoxyribonuclease I [Candidatus Saccharibacteria bacterium CG_4_9_14_0_2_um_filter_41_9]PJE66176.1 MAG: exodeoxyribonuclease I [Candidatus Saccharibacteria bacterium CG10_big_fil_rev_8_21_14_0_10_41_32]